METADENCPIELAMKLINKKWVIQILRDMFFGKSRFNEFKEDKPNLSNKVLSHCLKDMEENQLIKRVVNDDIIEYKLTKRGQALNKVLQCCQLGVEKFLPYTNFINMLYYY